MSLAIGKDLPEVVGELLRAAATLKESFAEFDAKYTK